VRPLHVEQGGDPAGDPREAHLLLFSRNELP
jgi:hypothetical protein